MSFAGGLAPSIGIAEMSANPMNFTENQQGNVVLEKLRQQREDGRFCDVVLVVQEKQFPAHRNILAACSPYFDSILKMHKVVKELVTVSCQSAEVFELLLNYMYSGNVVIDRNNVMELLKLANNFLVSKLKNYCAEYLDRYLDVASCLCVKDLAEKYNMPGLAKNAAHFVERNINAVLLESKDVLDYSVARAEAFLSDKCYANLTPDVALRFVVRYVQHRAGERSELLSRLLEIVQTTFGPGGLINLNVEYLLRETVDQQPLFQQNGSCLLSFFQFLIENGCQLQGRYQRIFQSLLASTGDVSIYFNNCSSNISGSCADQATPGAAYANGGAAAAFCDQFVQSRQPPSKNAQVANLPETLEFGNDDSWRFGQQESVSDSLPTEISSLPSSSIKLEPRDPPSPRHLARDQPTQTTEVAVPTAVIVNDNFSDANAQPGHLHAFPPVRIKLKLSDRSSLRHSNDTEPHEHHSMDKNQMATLETVDENVSRKGKKRRGRPPKLRVGVSTLPPRLAGDNLTIPTIVLTTKGVRVTTNSVVDSPIMDDSQDAGHSSSESLNEQSGYQEGDSEEELSSEEEWMGEDVDDARAEVLFKCPHCVYTSGCQSRIQSHIEKAHSKNRIYICPVCAYECKWNREYYMHMKSHFQGPPFRCDNCDYSAERIQMLLTHRMKHTDERPFKCKHCEYRCRTKTNLVAHMRSHTGEKPFICPSCFRGFAIKSTLDQHLATHSDARPFVCDQCSFSTKYQSHLISHRRIHTGDVFRCQYLGCTYSSPKKSQLAAHMRTHMAVRSHTCKQCGRSFIEKSHLVRHERIHLQIKPFKCDRCNYASSRRDKLKEHVQKHHTNGATTMSAISQYHRTGSVRNPFKAAKRGRNRSRLMSALAIGGGSKTCASIGRPQSSMGFRPITPQNGCHPSNNSSVNNSLDYTAVLTPPNCVGDAMVPLAAAYQPSPFEGGGSLNDGDVLLSTQTAGFMTDSPQSTTVSLLSDPFPSAATPIGEALQRPVSLPPLGAQGHSGSNWPSGGFSPTNSYMAMF